MTQTSMLVIVLVIGMIGSIIILKHPYIGVALTVVSTPISALLPPIPFFSSIVPLIGLVTLVGFLWVKRNEPGRVQIKIRRIHTLLVLFILWIFVSNPEASWFGQERNWVFTYIQLFVLMVIASNIMDQPHKHRVLMGLFAFVSVLSAFTAINQGYLGDDILEAARVGGFTAGANTAARYFVVAMVMLSYLRNQVKDVLVRLLLLVGIFITYLGVFYTASRTGMILIFFAQLLLFFFQHEGKQRVRLLVLFGVAFVILFISANTILTILQGILPAIVRGTDTVGLRYDIWRAGWNMWQSNPIRGVGIGRFVQEIRFYLAMIGAEPRGISAHNTYINILAETGIIGFVLFMALLWAAFKKFYNKNNNLPPEFLELKITWLIIFLVVLLGAVTKTEHTDKLLFMVMGLSVYFAEFSSVTEDESLKKKSQALPAKHRYANRF